MTSGTDRTAPLVLLRTWLLPLTVGAAAVGAHYVLHVPPGSLPPPSPAELEAEKKASDKLKREEEARQRAEDRKAGKRPRSERSTVRELAYEPFRQPRPAHIIEQLWAYYEPMPLKREPTFEAWQTAHKSLLWQIVEATRLLATPDAPAIEVASSECHTIRCQFTITAPTKESLTTQIAALELLRLGADPLWHSFEAGTPVADKPKTATPAPAPGAPAPEAARFKATLTISFTRDLPTLAEISLPGKGPLHTPGAPSSVPSSVPSPAGPRSQAGAPGTSTGTRSATTSPTGTSPATRSPTGARSPTGSTKPPKTPRKPADPAPG